MTTLYGSISNTAQGAAAGASFGGGWGALAGGVAGLLGSFLGGNDNSSQQMFSKEDLAALEMWNVQKALGLMKRENKYNQENMRLQTDLQSQLNAQANEYQKGLNLDQFNYQAALNRQAFDYNNYFLDNAYQKAVASMRKSGLNPLLLAGNSPSVGSAMSGSAAGSGASAGSASALGVSGSIGYLDPASMLSASASSAQAKIAKQQLKLNALNALSDIALKGVSTAKTFEETKSEKARQDLINSQTELNFLDKSLKEIQKSWLPHEYKAKIYNLIEGTKATIITAQAKKAVVPSEIQRNSSQAALYDRTNVGGKVTNYIINGVQEQANKEHRIWKEGHTDEYGKGYDNPAMSGFDKRFYKWLGSQLR